MSTAASPDYLERSGRPTHPSDLPDHDGILFSVFSPDAWTFLVDGERIASWPRFRVRANSMFACIQAAVRGFGIARVGSYHVAQELRSGTLVRILKEYECASIPVHLVYVKQGLLPLKVRTFLDWMAPRLKQRLNDFNAYPPSPRELVPHEL